jgi:hypothetical protein
VDAGFGEKPIDAAIVFLLWLHEGMDMQLVDSLHARVCIGYRRRGPIASCTGSLCNMRKAHEGKVKNVSLLKCSH